MEIRRFLNNLVRFSDENPRWFMLLTFSAGLVYASLDENSQIRFNYNNQPPAQIEQNIKTATITSGGGQDRDKGGFIKGWGLGRLGLKKSSPATNDPKVSEPPQSLSQLLKMSNEPDQSVSLPSFDEIYPRKFLGVEIDFPYIIDGEGHPVLLVPTENELAERHKYIMVDLKQTCAHLHHANNHGISLPNNFNWKHYKGLITQEERLDYAKKKVPINDLIKYQNKLARSICRTFAPEPTLQVNNTKTQQGVNFKIVLGKAGVSKETVFLGLVEIENQQGMYMLSIIQTTPNICRHISSYPITTKAVRELAKNGEFWVLRSRTINWRNWID